MHLYPYQFLAKPSLGEWVPPELKLKLIFDLFFFFWFCWFFVFLLVLFVSAPAGVVVSFAVYLLSSCVKTFVCSFVVGFVAFAPQVCLVGVVVLLRFFLFFCRVFAFFLIGSALCSLPQKIFLFPKKIRNDLQIYP